VFNVEQIEGLPEHYYAKPEPTFTNVPRIDHADPFFADTPADIRYRGGRAYYAQEADCIQMPPCRPSRVSVTLKASTPRWRTKASIAPNIRPGST
jgi:antirestriction protein ArdC